MKLRLTDVAVCCGPESNSTRRLSVLRLVMSSLVIEEIGFGLNGRFAVIAYVIESKVASPSASKPYDHLQSDNKYQE